MTPRLFAVYLGGRAPGCNTELHDVVFAVGASIEDTYERLLGLWFGSPEGLHIDSWMELTVVDEYQIILSAQPVASDKKLYFVNLGAYADGQFTELHANALLVAGSEREAKSRAKSELLVGRSAVHTDDLFDVDDCLEIGSVDGYQLALEPTSEADALIPHNGYHIIPKTTIGPCRIYTTACDRQGNACTTTCGFFRVIQQGPTIARFIQNNST